MKFCCLSDLHGYLPPELPDCDAILIAGDICNHGGPVVQLTWLDTTFRKWLEKLNKPVIACAGNHDWVFARLLEQSRALNLPWTFLQDESYKFYLRDSQGIMQSYAIYGTPWQRRFFNWAFNLEENQLAGKWNKIPNDTDILICHSPPKYYGDTTPDGQIVGSESLLWRIQEIKLKLCVYGHIHLGYGQYFCNNTILINASINDEQYKPINKPIIIEI